MVKDYSKYRFKTKEEFIDEFGSMDNIHAFPWNMHHLIGENINPNLISKSDTRYALFVYGSLSLGSNSYYIYKHMIVLQDIYRRKDKLNKILKRIK